MSLVDVKNAVPVVGVIVITLFASVAVAGPDYIYHDQAAGVYGQSADVTMLEPLQPRESEVPTAYFKMGPSLSYASVAVYYTTNGSTPQGSRGKPQAGTYVLLSYGPAPEVTFLYNEGASDDWWRAKFPYFTAEYGTHVRYKIGAWQSGLPGETFAGGGTVYEWTTKLAWPGKGSPHADPSVGYPNLHFWKEEGVVGNNYINTMIDQNGSVYDIYYPSAGCVDGMGTKNEGYVDGLDTFPPGLPTDARGQMNINQAFAGLRVDNTTFWLTNEAGGDYTDHSQSYVANTNVIETSQRLVVNNNDILVQQYDYSPKGIVFPTDQGGNANRGLYIKRILLTNNGTETKEANVYLYVDFALNGGDNYDGTYSDNARGAIVAYDNTYRSLSPGSASEYNPTSGLTYEKDVSVYLAAAMRLSDSPGSSTGTPAADFWNDTSTDQGQGWVGMPIELPVGVTKEVAILFVGGFDAFAGATGTYDYQMAPVIDWFMNTNLAAVQATTEAYWSNWLAGGVTVDTPDDEYDELFKRSLLATALHLDGKNGGIIAGMHNGAYPFVWPRDAAWAAITLDRTGHTGEASEIYRFLREVTERFEESAGRTGWWYQKYTTDGKKVWTSPQVDETSCFPWGVKYHYDVTGDLAFLDGNYPTVYEAAVASSEDSDDTRLYFDEVYNLVYSNNLWEDSWDEFLYSNASVERGLRDAAAIADILDENVCPGGPGTCNYHNDVTMYTNKADLIHSGMDARLAWDGENTDISQLGLAYPFGVYNTKDPVIEHMVDRINGVAASLNGSGDVTPLVNYSGEWEGLINRYWGDTYWHNTSGPNDNASPWFLSTMWYGCYYAERQDSNPHKGDIDNHKYRLDLLMDRVGPIGFGAEQIAPSNSLLYDGQMDFVLETAWPNAWESMSFFVDSLMMFLDYTPDADGNVLRIEPKIPSAWSSVSFGNLTLGDHRIDVTCSETSTSVKHQFTNVTGQALGFDTVLRVPVPTTVFAVVRNGEAVAYNHDMVTGRIEVAGSIESGVGSVTTIGAYYASTRGDADNDGDVDVYDFATFPVCMTGPNQPATPECYVFDFDTDGDVDLHDYLRFSQIVP